MFYNCLSLLDINPLKNWDIYKKNNIFQSMFSQCKSLKSLEPIENWKLPKCNIFKNMFNGCNYSLYENNILKKWGWENPDEEIDNLF